MNLAHVHLEVLAKAAVGRPDGGVPLGSDAPLSPLLAAGVVVGDVRDPGMELLLQSSPRLCGSKHEHIE